jgi:hypothetical protein
MLATLEFDLPDDDSDFHDAIEGTDARQCVFTSWLNCCVAATNMESRRT